MASGLNMWQTKIVSYASVQARDDDVSGNLSSFRDKQAAQGSKERIGTRFEKVFKDTWTLEVVSAVISVLAFIAIIAILGHFDGRRVVIMPHSITLNGIVSVLATVAKATLLTSIAAAIGQSKWLRFVGTNPNKLQELQAFDDASRGPLGSFQMMLQPQIRSIALLGALLTVLSAGFDPSLQLLIHTNVRVNYANDTGASLTYAADMSDPEYYTDGLSLAYRSAVVSALSDNAGNFDITPTCPSKNCTWPEYQSLSVFAHCTNITQWMFDHNTYGTLSPFCSEHCAYSDDENGNFCDPMSQYTTTCKYVLPLPFGEFNQSFESVANTDIDTTYQAMSSALPGQNVIGTEGASLLDQDPAILPIAVTASVLADDPNAPIAYMCSFSFRLDTLNTTVKDGVVVSNTLGSIMLANTSTDCGKDCISLNFAPIPGQASPSAAESLQHLSVDAGVWNALNSSMIDYFTGQSGLTESSITHEEHSFSPAASDEIVDGMFRTRDLSAMMDRVAASFTKQIRQEGGKVLTGQSGSVEIYFKIKWAWITLPATVLVGAIVFLAMAMFETRRRKVEIWKNSTLPLMYNASDCDLKRDEDPVTLSEMGELAEKTMITVQRSSSLGWAFNRTDGAGDRLL